MNLAYRPMVSSLNQYWQPQRHSPPTRPSQRADLRVCVEGPSMVQATEPAIAPGREAGVRWPCSELTDTLLRGCLVKQLLVIGADVSAG